MRNRKIFYSIVAVAASSFSYFWAHFLPSSVKLARTQRLILALGNILKYKNIFHKRFKKCSVSKHLNSGLQPWICKKKCLSQEHFFEKKRILIDFKLRQFSIVIWLKIKNRPLKTQRLFLRHRFQNTLLATVQRPHIQCTKQMAKQSNFVSTNVHFLEDLTCFKYP